MSIATSVRHDLDSLKGLAGLLFFPLTAFTAAGEADLDGYRRHVKTRLESNPGAIFACCGTGEFFALNVAEYSAFVRVAVEEAAGSMPVIAGVGYGGALAATFAAAAKEAGADGLLVMPPHTADGGQAGLRQHYLGLADASELDLILYQRDNTVFSPETVAILAAHPRIVGFKDGRGDLDLMRRITGAVTERHGADALLYFNGLPTAEMSAQPYRSIGITAYSSAVFCFAPDIALEFYRAYQANDDQSLNTLIDGFFRPYVDLRDQGRGYAVSLVKAGARLQGHDVGPVRAPLSEPTPEHLARLAELIDIGRSLVSTPR